MAQDTLFVALLMTMLAAIVLGSGLPTTPSYILLTALLIPAIMKLGVIEPAAHMFAFYYAVLSAITPPVALAVFAAAGLAKADMWDSSWAAMKIGAAGFIIPFMFVYQPALLMIGDWPTIIWSFITSCAGIALFAGGLHGYFVTAASYWQRALLTAGGIAWCFPGSGPTWRVPRLPAPSLSSKYWGGVPRAPNPPSKSVGGHPFALPCSTCARPAAVPPITVSCMSRMAAKSFDASSAGWAAPKQPASILRAITPATISRAGMPTVTPTISAAEPVLRREFARTVEFIRKYRPRGRLLEVGCAYGFFLQEAKPLLRRLRASSWRKTPRPMPRQSGLNVLTGVADQALLGRLGPHRRDRAARRDRASAGARATRLRCAPAISIPAASS